MADKNSVKIETLYLNFNTKTSSLNKIAKLFIAM